MNTAPDLIIFNGTIHTLDPRDSIATAMAVSEGIIVALAMMSWGCAGKKRR